MVQTFLHFDGAPTPIVPSEVDSAFVAIEEGGEGQDFWKAVRDNGHQFLSGDEIEHITQVDEDGNARWQLGRVLSLGSLDVSFDLHGGGLDREVHASLDADRYIEWKKMVGESAPEVFGDVAGYDSAHGGRDADGSKLSLVGRVFVEEEKVRVGEESVDVLWYMVLEDQIEKLLEGHVGGWVVGFGKINEGVN